MKVFISWSGDQAKVVAEELRGWLPTVLAGRVECFVSSQDIRRGERGMNIIAAELEERDYGIVVLTKENMASPWVNFEAGALGKSLGEGKVSPLLLDITRADVIGPLGQFQSSLLTDKSDMRQFIRDLAVFAEGVPEESLDALFEVKWPALEKVAERAAGMVSPKTTRTPESMMEEVLEHVRALRKSASRPEMKPPVVISRDEFVARNRSGSLSKLALREPVVFDHEAGIARVPLASGEVLEVPLDKYPGSQDES